jgi:hypothetical protein
MKTNGIKFKLVTISGNGVYNNINQVIIAAQNLSTNVVEAYIVREKSNPEIDHHRKFFDGNYAVGDIFEMDYQTKRGHNIVDSIYNLKQN